MAILETKKNPCRFTNPAGLWLAAFLENISAAGPLHFVARAMFHFMARQFTLIYSHRV